jgi:flagellar biosynthesis protein FlhA
VTPATVTAAPGDGVRRGPATRYVGSAATMARVVPAAPGSTQLLLPVALVAAVLVMVLPLPPMLLDVLLALSISLSLLILLVSLYTQRPLEFSTFPSVLLVVTLFRLALNVASTRAILLHGHEGPAAAGHVIQAFGDVVVGGSYAVGLVVFLILVIVNFAVITKGAGRIAEVAARFTLDAMPGKQLAIDAELGSGLVTDADARARRRAIEAEADFYGAMDGASKFVRGDAVAGLLITAINIVGGFAIGVGEHGVDWATAARTYTTLTIGDGLVSQLPALLISTAAGIAVTRAAAHADLGSEVAGQLLASPRVLWVVTVVLGCLAVVPGLPFLPFVALGGITGALAAAGGVGTTRDADAAGGGTEGATEAPDGLLALDLMEIEVGFEVVPLVDGAAGGGDLVERIRTMRRQLALEMGFLVPPIHIRDNLQLPPQAYAVLVKGIEVARGELRIGALLAIDGSGAAAPVPGATTREPAFGLEARWIAASDRERAERAGYTVVDPQSVVVTHLTEVIRRHAHELLGRQEVQGLLDHLARARPKVVEELVPQLLPVGGVQKVLQNLLREGVSIRDLATVLEAVADHAARTKDPDVLTEHARRALGRAITQKLAGPDGTLALVTLEASLERTLAGAVQRTDDGAALVVEPATAERLVARLGGWMARFAGEGAPPVLLCSAALRPWLRRFLERYLPSLVVLAPAELAATARVRALGVVTLDDA